MSLLAVPFNAHVLGAMADGTKPLVDLRRAAGSPPQTTMRGHLRSLVESGIVERHRQPEFPGSVDLGLATPGRELLGVAGVLRTWLLDAPEGALQPGSAAAKATIKALVEGWSSGIIRALAGKPLALTELSRLITGLSYPSLERRLGAMRLAGLVEPAPGGGRATPYKVTGWLRHAVAPLLAAAAWERRNLRDQAAPLRRLDIESVFLLSTPLVSFSPDQTGECRLAVEMRDTSGEIRHCGAIVTVKEGRVIGCVARLQGEAGAWIAGSVTDWLEAVIEDDSRGLETGGDCDLALGLLGGLHTELFAARQRV